MDANTRMKELLGQLDPSPVRMPKTLSRLANQEFVTDEGCYFLQKSFRKNRHFKLAMFYDETDYETLLNHFHLDSYMGPVSLLEQLKVALEPIRFTLVSL